MKLYNRKTGGIGEQLALEYLLSKNYELITMNYSTKYGEIDLIMKDRDILVFVEVKTKKGQDWGTPEEMFTRGKYRRVRNMATIFLQGRDVPCRIDMVAVDLSDTPAIRHYPNVTFL
jgi:putative endonuclease